MQKAEKELTLRMDAALVERAERYAEERGTSVSKLVAGYLAAVTRPTPPAEEDGDGALGPVTRSLGAEPSADADDDEALSSPITRSLIGLAAGSDVTEEDYRRYLEEKHR